MNFQEEILLIEFPTKSHIFFFFFFQLASIFNIIICKIIVGCYFKLLVLLSLLILILLLLLPLFKDGSLFDRSNFRPISVLATVPKVLERHVHSSFYNFSWSMHYLQIFSSDLKSSAHELVVIDLSDKILNNMDTKSTWCNARCSPFLGQACRQHLQQKQQQAILTTTH